MSELSRREMLGRLFRPLKSLRKDEQPAELSAEPNSGSATDSADGSLRAVIQGRYCLAYQQSFCSTCYERCPEPGAIEVKDGFPMVVADKCTGCGICADLCPAPTKAILMLAPRK